jgi:hypothetical protein
MGAESTLKGLLIPTKSGIVPQDHVLVIAPRKSAHISSTTSAGHGNPRGSRNPFNARVIAPVSAAIASAFAAIASAFSVIARR